MNKIHSTARSLIPTYSLTKRLFLGPTSMDTELSLVMCNLACVSATSVCLDPFCGSGSILVALSIFGGLVFGSDLNRDAFLKRKRVKKRALGISEAVASSWCHYTPKEMLRMQRSHRDLLASSRVSISEEEQRISASSHDHTEHISDLQKNTMEVDMFSNFDDYGLPHSLVMCADASVKINNNIDQYL
ncbi:tRNA (guanine(10)-N2)-methyltransferase [Aduncisulcus paluster]|uniref:tRNA (Guanine(10)-N2)-methyltransferase n=1 Tax=Aduncisulcus paluster TaxID=2918883 RepID=A0ABQ5K0R2_9EUKA|nr:tRNA (guanine(10)-N2)-methyltransferase [Aduncisulcus paluster]